MHTSLISNDGILGGHVACLLLSELDGASWATITMSPELNTVIAREQAEEDCNGRGALESHAPAGDECDVVKQTD